MLIWIKGIIDLVSSILTYINQRKLIKAGEESERARQREAADAIKDRQDTNNTNNYSDAIAELYGNATDSDNDMSESSGDKKEDAKEDMSTNSS
jgi:hypothetical protein